MKDKNDEISDMKCLMLLEIQPYLDNDRLHECFSCIYSRCSAVVKKFDEICHLGINEFFDFITLSQCLHVLEYKSCR